MSRKKPCSNCGARLKEVENPERHCTECQAKERKRQLDEERGFSDAPEYQKYRCRLKTRYYLRKGILVKERCYHCRGAEVEAHHTDYSDPLKVYWLCFNCHRYLHTDTDFRLRIHAMPPSDIIIPKNGLPPLRRGRPLNIDAYMAGKERIVSQA